MVSPNAPDKTLSEVW